MFGIHIITDVIKIPASDLQYQSTTSKANRTATTTDDDIDDIGSSTAVMIQQKKKKPNNAVLSLLPIIHREIDLLYSNRVLINIGLVISRYYNATSTATTGCTAATTTSSSKKRKRQQLLKGKKQERKQHQKDKEEVALLSGTRLLQNGGTCDNNNGTVHYTVQFPVIVFRPHRDEILIGTIYDMNQYGIIVTLGNFFTAIYIPIIYMLHPSTYDRQQPSVPHRTNVDSTDPHSNTGIWVWTPTYDDDDDDETNRNNNNNEEEEPLRYEMNIGDEIRVRVKSIHYNNHHPVTGESSLHKGNNSNNNNKATIASNTNLDNNNIATVAVKRPRSGSVTTTTTAATSNHNMTNHGHEHATKLLQHCAMYIIASICEDGLGLTSWWKNEENDDDDDDNIE